MRKPRSPWLVAALLAGFALAGGLPATARAQAGLGYKVVGTDPVVGDGTFDYLTFDALRGRLYVTRVGGVDVFDANGSALRLVGAIPALPSVPVSRAVLLPGLGLGFTSNGAARTTTIFSLWDLRTLGQFPLGQSTDAALFDDQSGRAVFFSPEGNDALVYDLSRHQVDATIPLGSAPEFAVVDTADPGGHIYVNLPDTGEVAEISVAERRVLSRHKVDPGCQLNSGLAIDPEDHLLFIGCAGALDVISTTTGANIAVFPSGLFIDAVVYDAGQRTAYAAEVAGDVMGVHVVSPSQVTLLGTAPTALGGRTLAEDTRNHRLFVAASDLGPPLTPGGAPSSLANTTRVLTLAPAGSGGN